MQPEVVVLDEPMAGLDPPMQEELTIILERLHASGMTIVIATHDLDFAYGWADNVIVLQSGRLLEAGTPEKTLLQDNVRAALGAVPLVAEISRQLALLGIDLRSDGYLPRSRNELVRALNGHITRKELVS